LFFGFMRKPSTRSASADYYGIRWFFTTFVVAVLYERLRLVPVLRLRLRGLFGRSFLCATVPQPVPSWTPADRKSRPRSGAIRPTPIKSVRSSCGTPCRSIIRETPGQLDQVKGKLRAGMEPQGFSRQGGESTPSQKSICFLPYCYLQRYT